MENNYLYVKQSTIPNIGEGAFAKDFIPIRTVICEYEGDICTNKKSELLSEYDKNRCLTVKYDHTIIGSNIGSKINNIVKFENYSDKILIDILWNDYLLLHKTLKYNCYFQIKPNAVIVEVVTLDDIKKDSELFIPYGKYYWQRNFDITFYHYHERKKAGNLPLADNLTINNDKKE